jgi:hypothetical protein
MERWQTSLAIGIIAVMGIGCGKSQPAGGAAGQTVDDGTPDKAVKEFLSAARAGDQKKLTLLLSKAAQEQASKNNVNFELDSYQNATFEVGEFEYLTEAKDSAHVGCKWTDRDPDGNDYTHPVVWVLRKEDSAWRIAGMILRPFPDKPPVVLNYEDMSALHDAKEFIEQESQRRMQEEQQQAAARPVTASDQSAAGSGVNGQLPSSIPAQGSAQQPAPLQQAASAQQAPGQQAGQAQFQQTAQRPGPGTYQPK